MVVELSALIPTKQNYEFTLNQLTQLIELSRAKLLVEIKEKHTLVLNLAAWNAFAQVLIDLAAATVSYLTNLATADPPQLGPRQLLAWEDDTAELAQSAITSPFFAIAPAQNQLEVILLLDEHWLRATWSWPELSTHSQLQDWSTLTALLDEVIAAELRPLFSN